MKKILCLILVVLMICGLCACNKSYGFGNYEFKKVHIDTHNYSGCFTVKKWYESETGVEVKTEEAGSMFLAEGTYFLIGDDCPFCNHLTEKEVTTNENN